MLQWSQEKFQAMLIQTGLKGGVNKVFCGQCQELILDLGKAKMVIARTQRFYSLNFFYRYLTVILVVCFILGGNDFTSHQ